MNATCLIDGFGPLPVVAPQSTADVCEVVRRARAEESALYPLGGRTLLGVGLPPTRPGVAIDLRPLDQVIDYPARDMTITVEAGITIARLQELLRTEKQRWPIDVPHADRATLGGTLATNTSGSHRYGFGTPRDHVIGISVINDGGQEAKAGGRVVKNVAGYDLCKLYIGALGTLGIIHQVTLRLRPLPEERALMVLGCEASAVPSVLDQLHRSPTRPVCIDLFNPAGARTLAQQGGPALSPSSWALVVGFEDNREAVAWQMQQLIKEVSGPARLTVDARVGQTTEPLWRALVEFPAAPGDDAEAASAALTFKANLLPSATAAFSQEADSLASGLRLQAHAGSGIVVGHAPADLTLAQAEAMLGTLQEAAGAAQGNVVVLGCAPAWKKVLPVWGKPRGDAWLMQAVKDQLDPRRLFNPGRFVDGL